MQALVKSKLGNDHKKNLSWRSNAEQLEFTEQADDSENWIEPNDRHMARV